MSLTRRAFLAAAPLSLSPFAFAADQPKLTLSTFQVEVTPPIGHPCMGGGIAPVKEILDPLYANGLVLRGLDKPVAIVAVDWCEIRNDAYDRWREAIAEAIGTTRDRVLLSALHQHDTPIADLTAQKLLDAVKAKGSICDLAFHEKTVNRVTAAAKASLAGAQPITHYGTGQAKVEKVASNRRYLDPKGNVRYDRMSATRNAEAQAGEDGIIDPYLKTLSFWNGDRPLVALSSYATHPMSFYGRGGVTADFVGLARRLRQAEEPALPQFYISGCSGNITAGKYNDGSAENRPTLAKRIHQAMQTAWKETKKKPLETCQFRSVPMKLSSRTGKGFSEADLQERLANDPRPFGQCLAALGLSWLKRVRKDQPVDVGCLDLGGAVYLLLPAEAYVEFQLVAQQARPQSMVMVAGYGESGPGYIPVERAWKENDSNLHDWCWVDPGSEKAMREAIVKVLNP
jgi:hypothetical protein